MRHVILGALALACALPAALPAHAQDQASVPDARELETARQIIAVMFPADQRDAMMQQMMGDVAEQFSASIDLAAIPDDGLQAIFRQYMADIPAQLSPLTREHFPTILEATAVAYADEFTQAELDELLAFARTPAGTHYFSRVTALAGHPAVAAANTAYFTELQQVNVQLQAGLRERVNAYLAENPAALEKMQQAEAANR